MDVEYTQTEYCRFTFIHESFIFANIREFECSRIKHPREMFGFIEVT